MSIEMTGAEVVKAAAVISAGFCMGFSCLGPGIGEGYACGKAVEAIAKEPSQAGAITRTMLVGQAVTESPAIYALVISLLLLFVV